LTITPFVCVPRQVFMGGKYLPTPAWLVFFAVVDELSAAGSGRPEVWSFLRDQCLTCIKSTRDFSDIGDRVPLLEAMVHLNLNVL
jgi:hypothetical protein